MNKKILLVVVAVVVLAVAVSLALRGSSDSGPVDQAEISNFAKSIDHTKSDTPSVPQERLNRGRTGRQPISAK